MPYKDKEKNREYQRKWAEKKRKQLDQDELYGYRIYHNLTNKKYRDRLKQETIDKAAKYGYTINNIED